MKMKSPKSEAVQFAKAAIDQKLCWYVSCGAVGTTFQLALGEKRRRTVPLKNKTHPKVYRVFEGESNLLVWCAWRLETGTKVLSSSNDLVVTVERTLSRLIGKHVTSAEVLFPSWDIVLKFSNRYVMRIFCDHVPGDPSFDGNWDLFTSTMSLHAGPGETFIWAKRKGDL